MESKEFSYKVAKSPHPQQNEGLTILQRAGGKGIPDGLWNYG